MKIYSFGIIPLKFYCGGGPAPADPPPPPPDPQMPKVPDAMAVRKDTAMNNVAQGGGKYRSTLLTGGDGDTTGLDKLGRSTLLGRIQ